MNGLCPIENETDRIVRAALILKRRDEGKEESLVYLADTSRPRSFSPKKP